jgi:hypothetical protein
VQVLLERVLIGPRRVRALENTGSGLDTTLGNADLLCGALFKSEGWRGPLAEGINVLAQVLGRHGGHPFEMHPVGRD